MNNRPPCIAWAEKLALRYEDLSPADRIALDEHMKTCPACKAAQADYYFLDARLRALPPPALKPLPRLSPLLALKDGEDKRESEVGSRVQQARLFPHSTRPARRGPSFMSSLKKALPVVLVASLVLALLLLFGSRSIDTSLGRPIGTTLFTYAGHTDFVDAVAWSPDGRYIASGSWDNTVQVWQASNNK
ncbi:MAG: hypothetical protein NVS3B14_09760 [Ktedonobacteraceae bacterium]